MNNFDRIRLSRAEWAAASLLAVYLLTSFLLLRLDSASANWLVSEDAGFEVLGALGLLLGAGFVFMALVRMRARGDSGRVLQLSYLGLALLLFVAAGEEISWGQRLIGLETPESVRRINAQGEINLHNLYGDEHGQNASRDLFVWFWRIFGIVIPLAAVWKPLGRRLRRYVPVLPVWIAVLFIGQQLLWKPVRANWRTDPSAWNATYRGDIGGQDFRVETVAQARERGVSSPAGLGEVGEANVQVLLFASAVVLYLGARRRRPSTGKDADAPRGQRRRFSREEDPISPTEAPQTGSAPSAASREPVR